MYVAIIEPPQNQSVCERGTASFICIMMFPNGTRSRPANWITDDSVDVVVSSLPGHSATDDISGLLSPTDVTNMLTVTNINISNNGTGYRCGIIDGDNFIRSNLSFLTVLGK